MPLYATLTMHIDIRGSHSARRNLLSAHLASLTAHLIFDTSTSLHFWPQNSLASSIAVGRRGCGCAGAADQNFFTLTQPSSNVLQRMIFKPSTCCWLRSLLKMRARAKMIIEDQGDQCVHYVPALKRQTRIPGLAKGSVSWWKVLKTNPVWPLDPEKRPCPWKPVFLAIVYKALSPFPGWYCN